MSQTFEYPPAFVGYRPLQHHNKVILETLYRLRHHFFLTRLKYAVKQIASLPFTDRRRAGLKTAIVSLNAVITTNYVGLTVLSPKEHVLISQGFCSVFGVSVPSPVFFQELITGFWPDFDDVDTRRLTLIRAIPSADVTAQDWAFCADITNDFGSWWQNEQESLPRFTELKRLFDDRMTKVSQFISFSPDVT